ncbi:MAG: enoyl-CoA hydratase/isomerase [Clostridia bacterium]|nr:enoyl-CoA hydratase/isomerase [Clostridia bacterium]
MNYQNIKVRFQESICFIQFYRPEANNTINDGLIEECHQVLDLCGEAVTIVVLEGLPEVFCFGADFREVRSGMTSEQQSLYSPEPLYDLWLKLATGPYITISHVRGKVNAGGVGFVAASDIVIADGTAQFSLSELLFGLFPACVLPFLVRRIGFQKANYLTLTTQTLTADQAFSWGLADAFDERSEALLHRHLLRLKRLSKTAVMRYKHYMNRVDDLLSQAKELAISANREVFSDPRNLEGIYRYIEKGKFPWEA